MQRQARGFFASLFDISFTSLITTKLIKVLYVLSLVAIGITYFAFVVSAFAASAGLGALVLLIVGPLMALFWTVFVRVSLEVVVALFRVMETNVEIAANTSAGAPSAPAGGPPPPPDAKARIE